MLDFSNYTSEFGDLKDIPLKKQDMEMIQEFQKRKIDMRMRILKQIPPH